MQELIGALVKQLGINEQQAAGGAGLLFKFAKDKLVAADFQQVSQALPGLSGLIKGAPQAGAGASVVGGLLSKLGGGGAGGLLQLASAFGSLKLDQGMIAKFIPVVLGFVKNQGGESIMKMLQGVLKT
ncbi:MAG TPA: DUF2780 domain-containing protein [Kiritimatiellia bacterium]|nr:DUF2780 domain-containing protein [Kiritimatiellia bacterium]HSA16747.1 DUF2780 domain-containing protein [Kiritimatiellia bacterium]